MNILLKLNVLERENLMLKEQKEKLEANVDYLSMMVDVPIPTEEGSDEPQS